MLLIIFIYYIAEPEKIQFQKGKTAEKENLVAKRIRVYNVTIQFKLRK